MEVLNVNMEKVYCIKDYQEFEKGKIYYSKMIKNWSGMTYTIGFDIFDMKNVKIGDIGYLYEEVFESLKDRRKKIIKEYIQYIQRYHKKVVNLII